MTQWGIDTLFNPGKRHMDEEKRRLQSTREEVGDSSGGRRIDLESGTVRLAGKADPEAEDAPTEASKAEAPQDDEPKDGAAEHGVPEDGAAEGDAASPADPDEDTPAARARRRRRAAG